MVACIPEESPKKFSEFSHYYRPGANHFKFWPKIQRKSSNLATIFIQFSFLLLLFIGITFLNTFFVADPHFP